MLVRALVCSKCKDAVFSRARHDMRWCSCHSCAIDGGIDSGYIQITGEKGSYDLLTIEVAQTKEDLYNDWSNGKNRYGIVKPKDGCYGLSGSEIGG